MATYEEFVKPHLKPKDGYEHILCVSLFTDIKAFLTPANKPINCSTSELFDDILVKMQMEKYEIIDFQATMDHHSPVIFIRYK